jgi:hypothetical protein
MTTDLDKQKIVTAYQCKFACLGDTISKKLSKYKLCNLTNEIKDLKFARALLCRITAYDTSAGNDTDNELINCINKKELCQILNALYCTLDKYCDC